MSAPASVFDLTHRNGIWRVTLDGAFFGDYRNKRQAVEGAESGARALRTQGRTAQVLTRDDLHWLKPRAPGPLTQRLSANWGAK